MNADCCPEGERLRAALDAAHDADDSRAANIARKAIAAHRATHGGVLSG